MEYPVNLIKDDNGTILVTFPDVDDAVTYGDTIEEALRRAPDALATILEAYIRDGRPIPKPSRCDDEYHVTIPAVLERRIQAYDARR